MSKRRHGSASESLAEALSRVMITREEGDHPDTYDWATQEGRGDRMPRFLERAIQDVPHASRNVRSAASQRRYQGSSRPFARATFLMSVVAIGTGIGVSLASPATVAPLFNKAAPLIDNAQLLLRTATMNLAFTSTANAATPRLAFGEALRNYTEQAAAQAARANIVVSNLTPGTTLSAGAPVSETAWSLPQSDLDHLVITFPTGAPATAMRATVEIPGNTTASTGKFSVELRQAAEVDAAAQPPAAEEGAPSEPAAAAVEAPAEKEAVVEPAEEARPTVKARNDSTKALKRKSRPSAALAPKQASPSVAQVRVTEKPSGATAAAKALIASASTNGSGSSSAGSTSPLSALFPSLSASSSPNALMMFSLGGPAME